MLIKSNFSFKKLVNKYKNIKQELFADIIEEEAKDMKKRLSTGTTVDGKKMQPIKDSTVLTRSIKNQSMNSPPLNASGRLLKSIKATKKGVSVKEYGSIQSSGYTPKKIPTHLSRQVIKRAASKRRIYFVDNVKKIKVPARQFIHTEETFNSLRRRKKIRKRLIRKINQALKK
tara:strand:- start:724 stop:1242 length:519 start_codon:yes stop_codon:yes gene_type:complete